MPFQFTIMKNYEAGAGILVMRLELLSCHHGSI